jgi:hypothetical protein
MAWALILGLVLANIIATGMVFGCTSLAAKMPRIRGDYIGIGVIVLAMLAQMSVRQNLWDGGVVLLMGLLGYMLGRAGVPVIGLVIGFVLGETMENDFYTALQSGRGSYAIFLDSALASVMAALTLGMILWMIWRWSRGALNRGGPEEQETGPATVRPFSPANLILAGTLALLLVAVVETLAPGYKGGPFLLLTLLLAIGCVVLGIGRNLVRGTPGEAGDGEAWKAIATGFVVLAAMFLIVVVLGMFLGTVIGVLVFMLVYVRADLKAALLTALGWGIVIPTIFQTILAISLWPGMIPELIPGILGGGLLPVF